MAAPHRTSLISKIYRVLKQRLKPAPPAGDRPLMEHLLFACCLENAPYEKAEKTFRHLTNSFFDWNEVRVSTVRELAEAMRDLPFPAAAASNLKRVLQTVFESTYSFELESIKRQNIGVGIKRLEKLDGTTPFVVAYATQHALGGHAIPLDRGAVEVLYIVGIASEAERTSGNVAGLERAIPKNKGAEFSSLLHQLAADFVANPFSSNVKTVLLAINPAAKDRIPKRGQKIDLEPKPPLPVAPPRTKAKMAIGKDGKKIVPLADSAKKALQSGKQRPIKAASKEKRRATAAVARSGRMTARRPTAHRQLAKRKPR